MPLDHTQAAAATFIFADIAGFTALTEAHGDEQAARLVADFSATVDTKLGLFGATQIKTIGDALMLRVADPQHAVLLGLTIAHDVLSGHGGPKRARRHAPRTGHRAKR